MLRVPIWFCAVDGEWKVTFMLAAKTKKTSFANKLARALQEDMAESRNQQSTKASLAHVYEATAYEEAVAAHEEFLEDVRCVVSTMPAEAEVIAKETNVRLDTIKARDTDEREILGVKRYLPRQKLREMPADKFGDKFAHVGCKPGCIICQLVKGNMRWITKHVDPYIDCRPCYVLDLDYCVMSERSKEGCKYMGTLRCRASKLFKIVCTAFKDDFHCNFVLPGTPVLVHLVDKLGSELVPAVKWFVAKGMLREQLLYPGRQPPINR